MDQNRRLDTYHYRRFDTDTTHRRRQNSYGPSPRSPHGLLLDAYDMAHNTGRHKSCSPALYIRSLGDKGTCHPFGRRPRWTKQSHKNHRPKEGLQHALSWACWWEQPYICFWLAKSQGSRLANRCQGQTEWALQLQMDASDRGEWFYSCFIRVSVGMCAINSRVLGSLLLDIRYRSCSCIDDATLAAEFENFNRIPASRGSEFVLKCIRKNNISNP